MILEILKALLITTISYLVFLKIANIKLGMAQRMIAGIGFTAVASTVLGISNEAIDEPYRSALIVAVSSFLLATISRQRFEGIVTVFILSYAVSYTLFIIAILLSAVMLRNFGIVGDNIIIYFVACALIFVFMGLLSKVKTNVNILLKKGSGGIGLIISGVVFIFYSLFREDVTSRMFWMMMVGIVLAGYGVFYWWKRETVIAHNEKVAGIMNKRLQSMVDEKTGDLEQTRKAHDYMASEIHKDLKTLDALQKVVEDIVAKSEQTEILETSRTVLLEIKTYRERLTTGLSKRIYSGKTLPQTRLPLVDAKCEILLEEATYRNIEFDFEINGKIKGIIQAIPQLDLVNIIGDLVDNSFVAIKHMQSLVKYRGVQISIGMVDDKYELNVKDSGIPFAIDTLNHLGEKPITTHLDEGGSGYGYMTVFEILKSCGASLTITEYEAGIYSKCVTIRFDKKAKYIIKTYRADQLKSDAFEVLSL